MSAKNSLAKFAGEFGKVGVLFGGRSTERVDAHGFDPGERSLADLASEKFDRVFIALHGRYGEDGTLQGVLEQLGIPYTGSGVMASAIGMDKIMTKRIWISCGLPTPRFLELDAKQTSDADLVKAGADLGFPLMLKAPHEGSTIGISKVEDAAGMRPGFDACARYDAMILAEEFVSGREFTVPILGAGADARALPVVEIRAPGGNYDYQNKYFSDETQYLCPAPLDAALSARMQALAVRAFNVLGASGWARIDFMLREKDGEAFMLEINTSPGMTGHSLVPMSAKATGIAYEDLCVEILRSAALGTGSMNERRN
jgi:D-alanine-D-alanine ligase